MFQAFSMKFEDVDECMSKLDDDPGKQSVNSSLNSDISFLTRLMSLVLFEHSICFEADANV